MERFNKALELMRQAEQSLEGVNGKHGDLAMILTMALSRLIDEAEKELSNG